MTVVGIDPEEALRMAITVPSRLMGLDGLARVTGRAAGDLLRLDPDWRFAGWLA